MGLDPEFDATPTSLFDDFETHLELARSRLGADASNAEVESAAEGSYQSWRLYRQMPSPPSSGIDV